MVTAASLHRVLVARYANSAAAELGAPG